MASDGADVATKVRLRRANTGDRSIIRCRFNQAQDSPILGGRQDEFGDQFGNGDHRESLAIGVPTAMTPESRTASCRTGLSAAEARGVGPQVGQHGRAMGRSGAGICVRARALWGPRR